jgi:hypothetical protein
MKLNCGKFIGGSWLGDYQIWKVGKFHVVYDGIDHLKFQNGQDQYDPDLQERADVLITIYGPKNRFDDFEAMVRKSWEVFSPYWNHNHYIIGNLYKPPLSPSQSWPSTGVGRKGPCALLQGDNNAVIDAFCFYCCRIWRKIR